MNQILTGQVFIDKEVTTASIQGRENVYIVVGPRKEGGLVVNLTKLKEGRRGPYVETSVLRTMNMHSTPLQGMKAGILELRRRRRI